MNLRTEHFSVSCNPPKATHQASTMILKRADGTQFIGKSSSSKGKKVRDTLLTLFGQHTPATPLDGPLKMEVDWVYPYNKTEPKKNQIGDGLWCAKRPDCDNLVKMVKDVLCDLAFYTDDAQVADLTFRKWYSNTPRIIIYIEEMEPIRHFDKLLI